MPHRATRDADLLGFGPGDKETVAKLFRDIAAVAVDDGIVFDPSTVSVQDVRKEAGYGGVRVLLTGTLARARCPTQVDVGFGDAVTPAPVEAIYPVLLGDMPAPRLRAYPACTVVAVKLHAIAVLGMTNNALWRAFLKKKRTDRAATGCGCRPAAPGAVAGPDRGRGTGGLALTRHAELGSPTGAAFLADPRLLRGRRSLP